MVKFLLNNELGRMWKETVMILSLHFLGEREREIERDMKMYRMNTKTLLDFK